MTCIVGLVEGGRVYVAGDSAAVGGGAISLRSEPKVFRVGSMVAGVCGSFRLMQVLRFALVVPAHPNGQDDFAYLNTAFVDAVRTAAKAAGNARTSDGQEEHGGPFLLGYRGTLYRIDVDYQVGIPLDGFAAVGSGELTALGALHATAGWSPAERLWTALEAAERFTTAVRRPFTHEVL